MDKHRELHDMLVTQGAGAENLQWHPTKQTWWTTGYLSDGIDKRHAHALIERAGILWLTKVRGCDLGFEGKWYISFGPAGATVAEGDTLIDAIHKAVTQEVGND
jgi:hypothetical protein